MNDNKHPTPSPTTDAQDIPVLTDVIEESVTDNAAPPATAAPDVPLAAALESARWSHIESELSARLHAELALQIPVLLEAALREHLPTAWF